MDGIFRLRYSIVNPSPVKCKFCDTMQTRIYLLYILDTVHPMCYRCVPESSWNSVTFYVNYISFHVDSGTMIEYEDFDLDIFAKYTDAKSDGMFNLDGEQLDVSGIIQSHNISKL